MTYYMGYMNDFEQCLNLTEVILNLAKVQFLSTFYMNWK